MTAVYILCYVEYQAPQVSTNYHAVKGVYGSLEAAQEAAAATKYPPIESWRSVSHDHEVNEADIRPSGTVYWQIATMELYSRPAATDETVWGEGEWGA